MARYLVTGGAGFIGAHLVRALLERGHDVVALHDLSGGLTDNVVFAIADAPFAQDPRGETFDGES